MRHALLFSPWLALLSGLVACSTDKPQPMPQAHSAAGIVYGIDGRQDVYAHPDATLRLRARQSTVALMPRNTVDARDRDAVRFETKPLGAALNLCAGERFINDPTAAFCSGTLIADDLVLTAGHCVHDQDDCDNTMLVFAYLRHGPTTLGPVTGDDLFECSAVVLRAEGVVDGRVLDYAVLQLDRPATPRFSPAPVRRAGPDLVGGQPLAVIGAPSGIPLKIDASGRVRDARLAEGDYFVSTVDAFGGNSGSGVYTLDDYSVAGVLVRGDLDYVARGDCNVVNVCGEEACRGEDVTSVQPVLEAVCDLEPERALCAAGDQTAGGTAPPPAVETRPFTASATASATRDTVDVPLELGAGDLVAAGTCALPGASGTGDTYVRLVNPWDVTVAASDDACGLLSHLSYAVPEQRGGTYVLRVGCFADETCAGTLAWRVTSSERWDLNISEVDYDQPGDDTAEFVEFINRGPLPLPLAGIVVWLVDGLAAAPYEIIALEDAADSLAPGALVLVHAPGLTVPPSVAATPFSRASNNLQNGPDGIIVLDVGRRQVLDTLAYEGVIDNVDVGFATVSLMQDDATPAADDGDLTGSLCRRQLGDANDAAADWQRCTTPTPGGLDP